MLVQLVNYNSLVNNSAVNTITDQQNIVQLASNLLEEENTPTWLHLQEVCEVNLGLSQTSNFSGEVGHVLSIYFRRVERLKIVSRTSVDFHMRRTKVIN